MDFTKEKFYVTTPIYYVTAKSHLGSLYSTLLADVAKRWHQLQGKNTFFLTGTDEHGQKVAQVAEKAGMQPKAFVDSFIDTYKIMWKKYHFSYDYFIRTTDEHHVRAVQNWLQKLLDNGDIYKSNYSGFYCTPCETYVTEKSTSDAAQTGDALEVLCGSCNRATHEVAEESYFFKLSAYQDRLLQFYKNHPDFITPSERTAEIISFVESGLRDLSISRSTITWGIPFPGDSQHVTYVWADALNNYITAIGYGDGNKHVEFEYWWPADLQILGKDIVRFHAIYWPAFLMASDLPLPKKLLVHGWIKVGDQKMSKSLGNVLDPQDLYVKYGADPVRYYLTRYMAITQDSPFSIQELEQRINSDLANDLGNLLQRMVALAQKHGIYELTPPATWQGPELALRDDAWTMLNELRAYMDDYMFHMAYAVVWKFIHKVNKYFHEQEPWKIAQNKERFIEILSATAHGIMTIAYVTWPVMPEKMEELLKRLGITFTVGANIFQHLEQEPWNHIFIVHSGESLFMKILIEEPACVQTVHDANVQSLETVVRVATDMANSITIDDLKKVELAVGTIVACEPLPKSDKLYKMQVDLGSFGVRQILAGLRQAFTQDQLLNKQAIFVVNLKPRIMLGHESHGMMLVALSEDGQRALSGVHGTIPNGTRLQ